MLSLYTFKLCYLRCKEDVTAEAQYSTVMVAIIWPLQIIITREHHCGCRAVHLTIYDVTLNSHTKTSVVLPPFGKNTAVMMLIHTFIKLAGATYAQAVRKLCIDGSEQANMSM